MNRITAVLATALAFASLAFVAGCNGAQFTEATPPDSGVACSTINPIISCDAGGPAAANACTAEPTSSDTVVARIPTGNYPVNCTVQFYFDSFGGDCSPAPIPCKCQATDAGAQWSPCADAGISQTP
jgi:hypothetical protein